MVAVISKTFRDADGRRFEVDFFREGDGSIRAYLKSNPWPSSSVVRYSERQRHLMNNGLICLSDRKIYDTDTAERRTSLWCNGFSYLMERGYQATCEVLPEWRS